MNPAKMMFPYIRTLSGNFGGLRWIMKNAYNYVPSCPTTYIYGKNKPVQIHSKEYLRILEARPGNKVVPTDGAHWIMKSNRALVVSHIMDAVRRLTVRK